jgi:hypothetical protein
MQHVIHICTKCQSFVSANTSVSRRNYTAAVSLYDHNGRLHPHRAVTFLMGEKSRWHERELFCMGLPRCRNKLHVWFHDEYYSSSMDCRPIASVRADEPCRGCTVYTAVFSWPLYCWTLLLECTGEREDGLVQ